MQLANGHPRRYNTIRYNTTLWLSDSLRDPAISRDSFKHSLKTFLFSAYSCT